MRPDRRRLGALTRHLASQQQLDPLAHPLPPTRAAVVGAVGAGASSDDSLPAMVSDVNSNDILDAIRLGCRNMERCFNGDDNFIPYVSCTHNPCSLPLSLVRVMASPSLHQ